MISAVTLDFWGTLLYDSPASDERYKQQRLASLKRVLNVAGVKVALRDLDLAYEESGRRLTQVWQTRRDVPVRQHVTVLLQALDPKLPERLPPEIIAALIHAYSSPALVIPPAVDTGAKATLEELASRDLRIGLISNTMRTPGEVLRKILDRYGLLTPFTVLTFSDECGMRKPDPEIFRLTLRQLGVPPEEAVHVGDDPMLDVEGARDAGMRVIQVAADHRATSPVKPDAVITCLSELPAALERLSP